MTLYLPQLRWFASGTARGNVNPLSRAPIVVLRTIRNLPTDVRHFFKRQAVAPFETATAFVAVWSGILNFFDVSVAAILFSNVLALPLVTAFNLCYLLSGFAVWAGLGWNYRNLEAFGLILLLTSLIIRVSALWVAAGASPLTINVLIQSAAFAIACLVRLHSLVKRRTTILVTSEVPLPANAQAGAVPNAS